ncbi:esterase/lipase [Acetobacter tropicalis NBRC 101654]|uniref:Esterase/lipase n=1 Tax=Acetobacter tropicalis NBRC 101654 TaxID=749388 RepID=F7VD23_9PROT|nr:esterase/lipase [Acetobacter tropicalis NBRC 101654]
MAEKKDRSAYRAGEDKSRSFPALPGRQRQSEENNRLFDRRQALCRFVAAGAGAAGMLAGQRAFAQQMSLPLASSSPDRLPPINGVYDWHALPPTPTPLESEAGGQQVDTGFVPGQGRAQIYFASAGQGVPVILLHDGLANSDYMSDLARALLRARCRVVVMDARGHGRSTMGTLPLSYDLLADDVVTLMAYLRLRNAAFVGWGDGAVQAMNVAMRHPGTVSRVFAFAPRTTPDGLLASGENALTIKSFMTRAKTEYKRLSRSGSFSDLRDDMRNLHRQAPEWSNADLVRVTAPLWAVAADHDELVARMQVEQIASAIENAGLAILPATSHFALLQNPLLFSLSVESFLGGR